MNFPNGELLRQFAKELELKPGKVHTVIFKMWVNETDPSYPYVGNIRIWEEDLEANGHLFKGKE